MKEAKEVKGKFIFNGERYDIKRLEDKSYYGECYYEILETSKKNKEIDFGENNIIYEEADDGYGTYEYWIGHFEGDEFVSVLHLEEDTLERVWLDYFA